MQFKEIVSQLKSNFGESNIVSTHEAGLMPFVIVKIEILKDISAYLLKTEELYFDLLECITGIDNGTEANTMELVYNLYSIPYNHKLCLKVILNREKPETETVSTVWRSADWHEREAFDLLGINFTNHPDLRRILLPSDWEGHPLRKDYDLQETYHDIKTRY
ncbi:MAG: NADH-quinone oxidoreductase subunit C [Bacteroidetes bacterium]|nr:MAG: NADH-quinone oxidoreductase subunit C [Bacteroidota bacterium]